MRGICVRGLKGEQLGEWWGSGRLSDEAPVFSERPLCRAEQVLAEQLSPSLEVNTLNYSHLSTSMLRVLPSRPSAFPLLLFFFFLFLPPPSDESFLPAKALPSSSPQLVCLPRWSFKPNSSMAPSNTLSLLCCVSRSRSQLIFTYVNTLML